jgi:hypothetical protein
MRFLEIDQKDDWRARRDSKREATPSDQPTERRPFRCRLLYRSKVSAWKVKFREPTPVHPSGTGRTPGFLPPLFPQLLDRFLD